MSEITKSIQVICDEKGLDYEVVMEALESALAAAYRKDFGNKQQNILVKFDPETGDMQVWDEKEVVEDIDSEVLEESQNKLTELREKAKEERRELSEEELEGFLRFNPKNQMMISVAKDIKKNAKIGDIIKIDLEVPRDFGRMAAQTAKQVIIQKLREAERSNVFEDFKQQEGGVIYAIVQRKDLRSGIVIVDLGKITGIVPTSEQISREQYRPGSRMQFFVMSVAMGVRGPEIILSRAHKKMVEAVFEKEIPEIASGVVQIKSIAREAGARSKVAVATEDESIDPIGSCIGQRGSRITTIIEELGGEKIDVILYSDNMENFVSNSLSPAKVDKVLINEENKTATAYVAGDQFSLAIGRDGQNVRLATELTGWKIKVIQSGEEKKSMDEGEEVAEENDERMEEVAEIDEKAENNESEEKAE